MDRSGFILGRLPKFYNSDEKLGAVVRAISEELGMVDAQISRLDGMVGIDTTSNEDLDSRWGNLLGIQRRSGESDALYANRLKTSVSSMAGGTVSSLKFAIAAAMGMDKSTMDSKIQVADAWEYDGPIVLPHTDYGYAMCLIDVDKKPASFVEETRPVIEYAVANTKASGVEIMLYFTNYRVMTMAELNLLTFQDLSVMQFNQIGEQV